ncbi:NAD(P)-dependent oxidoreductase [Streptomyces cyaneofuscatus]|uniref:NAD(P)-dependent oxidoreductase n=1 Tax=Streptomyces cyaneofuscatus TaxID=66883 RepID=UPI0036DC9474
MSRGAPYHAVGSVQGVRGLQGPGPPAGWGRPRGTVPCAAGRRGPRRAARPGAGAAARSRAGRHAEPAAGGRSGRGPGRTASAPQLSPPPAPRLVPTLPGLLATSDVVSLHLPLTPETRGLIGRDELALMRPGAILLNTARGGIVDEQALAEALGDPAHPLAAAAVDTFEHEHAAFASPLLGLPNALLTPHIAGMTRTAMATAALRCADHIAALLAGRPEGVPVATA